MATQNTCLKCGAPLTGEARQGVCPKCLYLQASAGLLDEEHSEVGGQRSEVAGNAPVSEVANRDLQFTDAFGDYELLEVIGRGGMGVVYRARQRSLDRIVAIKLMAFGPGASPDFIKRFRAEAVSAASLHHPNIVAIHEVGIHEGQHFFVMDYIEGQSLAQLVGNQPLPARRAASYLQTIAEAMHYAHERGILHRDLKPSNVLINSDDQPHVVDFGLARRLEGESELTVTGEVLGSPDYLPPEQATGQRAHVSRRTDVYALGATLYHLLTGRPPFQAESLAQTLDLVLHTDPVAPRLLNPSVPRDLETICLKCLEKEPAKRYATAQLLADELGRFLEAKPVLARPVGSAGKLWKWCRRKPVVAVLSLAVLLLALVMVLGAVLFAAHQAELRAEAEAALAASRRDAAELLGHRGDAASGLEILERAVKRFPTQPQLWNVTGLLLERSGRNQEALPDFSRAIALLEDKPGAGAAELNEALLNRCRVLQKLDRLREAGRDFCRARGIPIRDTHAPPALIDLSLFYDVPLTESLDDWRGRPGKDLTAIPRGLQTFAGVSFDVRGVVELKGTEDTTAPGTYRQAVTNIAVLMKFRRLHCLMATGWSGTNGTPISSFVLHYADGRREELPVIYGVHLRDWIAHPDKGDGDEPLAQAVVAWTGLNDFARSVPGHLRLYRVTWPNPRPEVEVSAIDFVSKMTRCSPFLVAMTVE